jgi:hypothetical protein
LVWTALPQQGVLQSALPDSDKNYTETSTISQVGDTKGDDGEVYQNGGPEWKCSCPVNPLSCTNVLHYLLAEV